MDESTIPKQGTGAGAPGDSSSGGWAFGESPDNASNPFQQTNSTPTASRPTTRSGSPIPPKTSPSSPPLPAPPATSTQLNSKAVAAVVAGAAIVTVALVVLLYLMTQKPSEEPVIPSGATPPPAAPTTQPDSGRAVELAGFTLTLPAGWTHAEIDGGYALGPAGADPEMFIYVDYDGTLQRLRPTCPVEADETTDEDTFPSPTRLSPTRSSPSPSPSTRYSNVSPGFFTLVGGEAATSETGSYECSPGDLKSFNSIIVNGPRLAITYPAATFEVDAVIQGITFG